MNILKKIITYSACTFLFLVGIEYSIMGVLTVMGAEIFPGILASFGLFVFPIYLVGLTLGLPNCSVLMGCLPTMNQEFHWLVIVLGVLSLIGGMLGLLGAIDIMRKNKMGYRIWLLLVIVSFLVSIWNIITLIYNHELSTRLFSSSTVELWSLFSSFAWAILYLVAYLIVKKSYNDQKSISNFG